MCTLSWYPSRGGYELCFNRDELRTRARGAPPELFELGGVRALAPRDGDHGGTWIAVSEGGLALALLNGPVAPAEPHTRTRGEVIEVLAGCAGAEEALRSLVRTDLSAYRPFAIFALDALGGCAVARWDGRALTRDPGAERARFLTSSSFDSERVLARRAAEHRARSAAGELGTSAGRLALHASHAGAPGPDSICMHRADAGTVSFTHVCVDEQSVRMSHAAGPPCTAPLGAALALERAGAGSARR